MRRLLLPPPVLHLPFFPSAKTRALTIYSSPRELRALNFEQNYCLRHARIGLRFSGFDKAVILQVSVNSSVVGLQVLLLLG